jgi:hypothetical protein
LILIDDKEDLVSLTKPRTLVPADISSEKTKTEKTEPNKLVKSGLKVYFEIYSNIEHQE